jgi:single-strand DNA-binding protein
LAVNRKFKTATGEAKEEAMFIDFSAFGRTGELINQYFKKGSPIMICGRLRQENWEDKNGGGKRSKISVTVEEFQFVGGPKSENNDGPNAGDGPDNDCPF